jgi:hypothetical protein
LILKGSVRFLRGAEVEVKKTSVRQSTKDERSRQEQQQRHRFSPCDLIMTMLTKQLRGVGFISVLWAPLFILRETNGDFSISTNQQHVPSAAEMYSTFASCSNDAQCLNGGTCTPTTSFNSNNGTANTEYARTCTCPRGYGGSHCQDHCPLQCQNGGYCQLLDGRDPAQYGGSSRSGSSSSSSSSSSNNLESLYDTSYTGSSSSARASAGSYQCKCRGLYSGKLCNIPYQNCPGGHKCYNGGSCVSSASSASSSSQANSNNNKYCDCPEGFGGLSCEQRSDGLGAGQGPDPQQQQQKAGQTVGIAVAVLLAVVVLAIGFTVVLRRRRRQRVHQQRAHPPYQFVMAKGSTACGPNLRPHSEEYWEPERMPHSAGTSGLSRTAHREKDPLRSVVDSRRSGIIARSESNDDEDDEDTMGMVDDDNAAAKHRWRNIV